LVQPAPNLDEKTLLVSKWHVALLGIVKVPQDLKSSLDIPWTILALHDMLVDYIQCFACISHDLHGSKEESAGADMISMAVMARESREPYLEAAAMAKAAGLGENTGP
jgi:hypothetical protein